jgi:Na+/glutamate symporter
MQGDEAAAGGVGIGIMVFYLLFLVFFTFVGWKLFDKAGKPGWASLVPIYNMVVFLQIVGKPVWWIVLMCIPVVSFVIAIMLSISLAERFGKGTGFGIGIALLGVVFVPMLAFGDAEYLPPDPA